MHTGCHEDEAIDIVGDEWRSLVCMDFKPAVQTPLRFSFLRICKSIAKQAMLLSPTLFGKRRGRSMRRHTQ